MRSTSRANIRRLNPRASISRRGFNFRAMSQLRTIDTLGLSQAGLPSGKAMEFMLVGCKYFIPDDYLHSRPREVGLAGRRWRRYLEALPGIWGCGTVPIMSTE